MDVKRADYVPEGILIIKLERVISTGYLKVNYYFNLIIQSHLNTLNSTNNT
jgi:hypothetical protein